jgi:hypothetical protein
MIGKQWWTNTASELTSIQYFNSATDLCTGYVKLYKRSSTESELVSRVAVDGDFSSGQDWTGLTGDSDGIYKFHASLSDKGSTAGYLGLIINGDTGSNYEYQYFQGAGTSVSSANASFTNIIGPNFQNQHPAIFDVYIFPSTGKYRPALAISSEDIGGTFYIAVYGFWWQNTTSEITSIKAYILGTGSTNHVLGEVDLKAIVLPT